MSASTKKNDASNIEGFSPFYDSGKAIVQGCKLFNVFERQSANAGKHVPTPTVGHKSFVYFLVISLKTENWSKIIPVGPQSMISYYVQKKS